MINKCFGDGTVTQLRKIGTGMVFAALAYVVSAAVQNMIDENLTLSPGIEGEITLKGWAWPSFDPVWVKFGMSEPNLSEPPFPTRHQPSLRRNKRKI